MNTDELLRELQSHLTAGTVSKEEVAERLGLSTESHSTQQVSPVVEKKSSFSITKLLYIIGSVIILLGLGFFVAQIWDVMGAFGRVLITLGLGVLLTYLSYSLYVQKPATQLGPVFSFIGGAILPAGVTVLLAEMQDGGLIDVTEWTVTVWTIALFGVYLLLNLKQVRNMYTLFAIFYGTSALYFLVYSLFESALDYRALQTMLEYLTMVIGASYLLVATTFAGKWDRKLIALLEFFGAGGIFLVGFIKLFDSGLWEFLFLFFVLGGLWLSVHMHSRIVLVLSTLFMLAYVSYITAEYFADSIGWPVALIILGFIFIGLGYASLTISKKYIQ